MKRRAEETQETPAQLINHVQSGASAAVQMEFPSRRTLAKVVNRVWKACASAPALPTDRAEWIGLVEKIYVDGTFSLSPKLFQQVFVVLAERSGFVFPVCYALLPNKSQASYTRMIQLLCTAWPHFKPTTVSLDFELGLINAFRTTFPDAEMNGCLFHLVKNMKGKLMDLGLVKRYNQDAEFALYARMIPAVAFFPPEHVDVAISELAPELPEELMPVLNYFEDNYVGRLRLAPGREVSRADPRFPIAMWSVYQRTLDGDGRTNNFAEAAHRRLQGEFGVDHPSLWKFIDGSRNVQQARDVDYWAGNYRPSVSTSAT
ncbi:uncharacterized protein LOC108864134 [Galendromus occidentalis]|uniref:Uncharacterized protein LOC108864134 n=1 Tax=Galendromus occidentalis TaxID=34638 RepID=A0AAJ7PA07_9ACAR|nr:uncharacterized protein LOC108864134 [Galendromus occidentalis]